MRTGRMNMPFLVQSARLVADGQGGHVTEWSTIAALWGALEDAYERPNAKLEADVTHMITTRPRTDLDLRGELRLVCVSTDQTYTLRQVRDAGRCGDRMKLFVRETRYLN